MTQVVSTVEEVEASGGARSEYRVAYFDADDAVACPRRRHHDRCAERRSFPNIAGPKSQDICYATENRQTAVKNVAHGADLVLVVGSAKQFELEPAGRGFEEFGYERSYLIDSGRRDPIRSGWTGVNTVAVTAGASAP